MQPDLNDLHTRIAIAETEIQALKKSLANLERGYDNVSNAIYEIKDSIARQSGVIPVLSEKIEKLADRMEYNTAKSEAVNEKLLQKFESFESSFHSHMLANTVTSVKVKVMWGTIVFLTSSLGALIIEVLKSRLGG
jgi:chromosome segregation ATPase